MQTLTQQSHQEMNSVILAQKRRTAILCLVTLLLWATNTACKSNIPKPPLPTAHTVGSNADSGPGSLREAINSANRTSGTDIINFDLKSDALRIELREPLPPIRNGVTLNGFNKSGGRVELDGAKAKDANADLKVNGLTIIGSGNTIQGLAIHGFSGHGVLISGRISGNKAVNNQVVNNFIGTDAEGIEGKKLGNGKDGIFVDLNSSDSLIARNLIVYNGCNGINLPDNEASKGFCDSLPADKRFPPPVRIAFIANRIFANKGIPVDLGNDGPTSNSSHRGDPDGPNNWQIFPEVTQAVYKVKDGDKTGNKKASLRKSVNSLVIGTFTATVTGTLEGAKPNSTITIQFTFCTACPSSCSNCARPQGEKAGDCLPLPVGSCQVTTDGNGNGSCEYTFPLDVGVTGGYAWGYACGSDGCSEEPFFACKSVTGTISFP